MTITGGNNKTNGEHVGALAAPGIAEPASVNLVPEATESRVQGANPRQFRVQVTAGTSPGGPKDVASPFFDKSLWPDP